MITRRKLLGGALAVGLAAPRRRARAASPLFFVSPFHFDPNFTEVMNAYSGGHFARAGVDVKVIGANGTTTAIQQVMAGQAQFCAITGMDFIRTAGIKGAPFQAIATTYQDLGYYIVSLKERPVTKREELRGKTIGILSIGGATELYVEMLLAQAGMTKSDANIVVSGSSPGEVEYIRQGRIDCFICSVSVVSALRRVAAPVEIMPVGKYLHAPGQVHWTTRELVETQPDQVQRYLRAIKASLDEMIAGPIGPLYERMGKDFEIPGLRNIDNLVAFEKTVLDQLWLAEGKANLLRNMPDRWQAGADALHAIGNPAVADLTRLYTNKFVEEL